MSLDRRKKMREVPDRRRSSRLADYKTVTWQCMNSKAQGEGILVQWSAHGLALLIEKPDTPAPGDRLLPRKRPDLRGWSRQVCVQRVQPLSDLLNLVAAEYVEEDNYRDRKWQVHRDRRKSTRQGKERRRSRRQATDKGMDWRIARGRRTRHSRLVERSLDGFVMMIDKQDTVPEGTRIHPISEPQDLSCPFNTAVIKRTHQLNDSVGLVFAEIEA